MAITGTKAFTSGEVLTANDVNQYLMRGVKVFSSTAVRDAAYGGAGEPVLEEGETAFITGTDTLQVYGGTAVGWLDYRRATAGQVLQTVSTTKTDTFSTTSTTFADITGMSAAITPSATSNLVLVQVTLQVGSSAAGAITGINLVRGSTSICRGDAAGVRSRGAAAARMADQSDMLTLAINFLDNPATTSSTTYKLQMQTSSGTSFLNRSNFDLDNTGFVRTASTITISEISA